MNILVTGGAGYIGSQTCKELAKAGYRPIVYDSLEHGHRWAVQWGPLVVGSLHDEKTLRETIRAYRPTAVMHFAAYAYVGESVLAPGQYYQNNVAGSLTLLRAMRDGGVNRLIFSSTCAVYGCPARMPIDESTPLAPINPYGASKSMVERMIADFSAAHGLDWVALRYFNAAGADIDGEIGEAHSPEPHLIPRVLDAAMGLLPAVTIYGEDYDTPDGTCIRDYIHVADLAHAHVAALRLIERGKRCERFNLGTALGSSVREIIAMASQVTGRDIPTERALRRPGDPAILVADPTYARREIDWQPRYSDLETIVTTAWNWHQSLRKGRIA